MSRTSSPGGAPRFWGEGQERASLSDARSETAPGRTRRWDWAWNQVPAQRPAGSEAGGGHALHRPEAGAADEQGCIQEPERCLISSSRGIKCAAPPLAAAGKADGWLPTGLGAYSVSGIRAGPATETPAPLPPGRGRVRVYRDLVAELVTPRLAFRLVCLVRDAEPESWSGLYVPGHLGEAIRRPHACTSMCLT